MRVDGRSENQREAQALHTQGIRAKITMFALVVSAPILSPFYLFGITCYQCCLVEKLTTRAKTISLIAAVFFSVAWIPYLNVIIYFTMLTPEQRDGHGSSSDASAARAYDGVGIEHKINAFTPLALFYIFCVWGLVVAFRHFSIADSYEDVKDRQQLRHLKTIELTRTAADQTTLPEEIHTAFDLYWYLKGNEPPHVGKAAIATLVFTAAVVTTARDSYMKSSREEFDRMFAHTGTRLLFILSTIDFCAIFFVFFCTLAGVIITFLHELRLLTNLYQCLPDLEGFESLQRRNSGGLSMTQSMFGSSTTSASFAVLRDRAQLALCPTNISHLRAWDEVRRVCVFELTHHRSVFQSVFAPTIVLNVLGFVGCYIYLVVRILFQNQPFGNFTESFAVFAGTMILYLALIIGFARNAHKKFEAHTTRIAKITFDASRQFDAALKHHLQSYGGENIGHKQISAERSSLLSSLTAMRTYMISNPPQIRILSFELRYIQFAALFFFLVNGNLMFFALMIAIRTQGRCTVSHY